MAYRQHADRGLSTIIRNNSNNFLILQVRVTYLYAEVGEPAGAEVGEPAGAEVGYKYIWMFLLDSHSLLMMISSFSWSMRASMMSLFIAVIAHSSTSSTERLSIAANS